jgi:hypothetical protein
VKRRRFLVSIASTTTVVLPGCGGSAEAEASSEPSPAAPAPVITTETAGGQALERTTSASTTSPAPSVVVSGRQWEELAVAPHERLISHFANSDLTNSGRPVTRAAVPYRDWGGFTVSPEGRAYYLGGGHSDYHGTDVDVCDLKDIAGGAMPWRQNLGPPFPEHGSTEDFRRPHVPPYPTDPSDGIANSGYGSAGSNWMWFNSKAPGSWQHDACHMYTTTTTHPVLGLVVGLYNVPNNLSMPASVRDHSHGLKSWSALTGKWTAHAVHPEISINSGLFGDYNRRHDYILWAEVPGSRDRVRFAEWSPTTGVRFGPWMSVPSLTFGVAHEGGCLWLSGNQFLVFRGAQNGSATMWLYDHSLTAPSLTRITPPLYSAVMTATPENGYWCADYDSQRVWWLVGDGSKQPKLYYAPLSSPASLSELQLKDVPEFRPSDNAVTSSGMRGLQYWNGHLWFNTLGAADSSFDSSTRRARFWRLPVA